MNNIDEIISKSKDNLSRNSLDLFECLVQKFKNIDDSKIDIQIEDNKDFIKISLTSELDDRISFHVDIFSGYCDFFIDNGKEVFVQYEFKSIQEADNYFREFLESPIQYFKSETKKGKLWAEQYILLSSKENITLSGKTKFGFVNKSKLIKSEKKFIPWIKRKTTANTS